MKRELTLADLFAAVREEQALKKRQRAKERAKERREESRRRALENSPERWRPPFVRTPWVQRTFGDMELTRTLGQFGVLVGASGIGKTSVLRAYASERAASTKFFTLNGSTGTKAGLEDLLGDAFGVPNLQGYRLYRAVREQLGCLGETEPSGNALLLFDEAQDLSREAIRDLRALSEADHSLPGCAMFFAGNESTLRGERRSRSGRFQDDDTWHRELRTVARRIAVDRRVDSVTEEDVDAIALAVGIDAASDPGAAGLLLQVAELPGCLGLVEQLLRTVKARGEPFTAESLKRAYEDHGRPRFVEQRELHSPRAPGAPATPFANHPDEVTQDEQPASARAFGRSA